MFTILQIQHFIIFFFINLSFLLSWCYTAAKARIAASSFPHSIRHQRIKFVKTKFIDIKIFSQWSKFMITTQLEKNTNNGINFVQLLQKIDRTLEVNAILFRSNQNK